MDNIGQAKSPVNLAAEMAETMSKAIIGDFNVSQQNEILKVIKNNLLNHRAAQIETDVKLLQDLKEAHEMLAQI